MRTKWCLCDAARVCHRGATLALPWETGSYHMTHRWPWLRGSLWSLRPTWLVQVARPSHPSGRIGVAASLACNPRNTPPPPNHWITGSLVGFSSPIGAIHLTKAGAVLPFVFFFKFRDIKKFVSWCLVIWSAPMAQLNPTSVTSDPVMASWFSRRALGA